MTTSPWQDLTNTGVPSGTVLKASGVLNISTAGAVVSGLTISGMLDIGANDVTLENCVITVDAYAHNDL